MKFGTGTLRLKSCNHIGSIQELFESNT
jgi:hypothetical protein